MTDLSHEKALLLAALALALLAAGACLTVDRPKPLYAVVPRDFGYRVDVNHADVDTLRLLPGIGATTAQYIIDHRTARGPIADPDDLIAVPRLGPKTVERLLPYVTFETAATNRHN